MSFFAMYPPLFHDRARDRFTLKRASVDELVRRLRAGGAFVGLHPEGKRSTSDDPYTSLPARSGTGRIIHAAGARAAVMPVFVNGLGNDIARRVAGNYLGTGEPVTIVFGAPIALATCLERPASAALDQEIADHALATVHALGVEERGFRATLASRP